MNGFEYLNNQGLDVQKKVKRHLESRGNTVIDVSQDKAYQKIDVDFLVRKDGQETTLEVKKDKNLFRTGNLFFEVGFMKGNYYTAGWLSKCQAQYLCYYDTAKRHGVIIDFPNTLPLLEKYAVERHFKDTVDGGCGKALLLKLEIARKNNVVCYEWQD